MRLRMQPKYLIVTCTGTHNGDPSSFKVFLRESVASGYSTYVHHWLITSDGEPHLMRPEDLPGIPFKGALSRYNKETLSVSLVGTDAYSEDQLGSLMAILQDFQKKNLMGVIMGIDEFSLKFNGPHTNKPGINIQELLLGAEKDYQHG